jgi:hypothetical protein
MSQPSLLGHRTRFEYHEARGSRYKLGTVIDETVIEIVHGRTADYATCVQLIQFDNDQRKYVRFGYWVMKTGSSSWTWANRPWVFTSDVTRRAMDAAKAKGFLD